MSAAAAMRLAQLHGEPKSTLVGLGGIASAFLEPDPDVQWDADRVASVRKTLTALGE